MSLIVESNGYSAVFSHTLVISSLLRSTPVEEATRIGSARLPPAGCSEAAGTYRASGP